MTTPRPNRIVDHRIVKGRDLLLDRDVTAC